MGDMFRSEKMSLCQVFLQPEAAYEILAKLGEEGCVQFRDMNEGLSSYQRQFVAEVRRCDELERKIRFVENEIQKDELPMPELDPDNIPSAPRPRDIIDLEGQLDRTEKEITELAQNNVNLKSNYLELTEMLRVLEKTQHFFNEENVINMEINKIKDQQWGQLSFLAGVVSLERQFAFERMLWRVARGKVYLKTTQLEETLKDPKTGNIMYKSVFVAFFQGEQLRTRVKKICTGFHASIYPCPSEHNEREDMIKSLKIRISDLELVLQQTEDQRKSVLLAVAKQLITWDIMVKKMKAIYHTLNMLSQDVTSKCLIGECWVPARDVTLVKNALSAGSTAAGSTVPSFLNTVETEATPPTYNRTNKFTRGFQNLIDAYGVSSYREANPALYTCITFPFLFAVMFGDMGHGFILFLFGLWMVVCEKSLSRKKNGGEIWNIFFAGRYIILLMGLFAIYTGFIYNDIFSKSINVFGSTWRVRHNTSTVLTNPQGLTIDPRNSSYGIYVMGMDPIWQFADNKIIFLNTYKMKLSIIFGVLHMVFGVCMSVVNFTYFRRYANILLEFLPQMIFLLLLFGYMVFMMFYKWVKYSSKSDVLADTPGCAPSVLIMFINMVLFKSSPVSKGCKENMFDSQKKLEMIFVVVAVICIPWMLVGKPLYIKYTRKHKPKPKIEFSSTDTLELVEGDTAVVVEIAETTNSAADGHGDHDEEPMSEIWIHQAIHTIEYVLSTISHTASYLRLWALSLAHAQLSEVLWTMVLSLSLQMKGYVACIAIFFIFAIWVFFTMSIMVMMEGLSAFLHTLRLHWVEFMSKFYEGAGHIFQPFSFKVILDDDEED